MILYLDNVNHSPWEVPDEGPCYLGVNEAVAHDEDVEERLAQGASVLHLPAGGVIFPGEEGIKLSHPGLVNTDLLLHVVPELPPHVLGPSDELPLPIPVHQRPQLLHKVLQTLRNICERKVS